LRGGAGVGVVLLGVVVDVGIGTGWKTLAPPVLQLQEREGPDAL